MATSESRPTRDRAHQLTLTQRETVNLDFGAPGPLVIMSSVPLPPSHCTLTLSQKLLHTGLSMSHTVLQTLHSTEPVLHN